jgi:hypothetical protein
MDWLAQPKLAVTDESPPTRLALRRGSLRLKQ